MKTKSSVMDIPGFADLQINGYKGVDFSSPTLAEADFIGACTEIIQSGTALFLPTLITSSEDTYKRNLTLMSRVIREEPFNKHIPGFHIEGPFLSEKEGARGAHNQAWIRKPDIAFFDRLNKWSGEKIKLLTIAAETEGAEQLCRYVTGLGISVSLGHQMAGEEDLSRLADAGARALTHLGNGLPASILRHDNPLWAGLAEERLTAMVITDGHHIPRSLIKTTIRTKGVSNVCIVSDASPIAGLPPGIYNTLGNNVVLDASGKLFNPDTGYLVGSSAMMIDCMNYLHAMDILEIEDLLKVGFHNPLRLIGENPSDITHNLSGLVTYKEGRFLAKEE